MKRCTDPTLLAALTLGLIIAMDVAVKTQASHGTGDDTAPVVHILGGTATFEADTNISAITVHGKSTSLEGRAQVRQVGDVIAIEQMEATLPVRTITTGLGLRDEHMRKRVFTATDGQTPDLRYSGEKADCTPAPGRGGESICKVSGHLAIRGTHRPFAITLKVKKVNDGYRAEGDGNVKLSTYGIAQPSQLGVKTTDDVKLRLEFTARAVDRQLVARAGASR